MARGASSALILVGLGLALARPARAADDAPKKLRELAAKAAAPAPTPAERARLDHQIAARIGRPPAPVISILNRKSHEVLVLEDDPKHPVAQPLFDRFLRCMYTNETHPMDGRLAGLLVQAARKFHRRHIEIVSGFRAEKFQLTLRKKGREVARDSQHSKGTAMDFLIPGVRTQELHDWVKGLHMGGVGLYLHSGFVHADTGRVRFWSGW